MYDQMMQSIFYRHRCAFDDCEYCQRPMDSWNRVHHLRIPIALQAAVPTIYERQRNGRRKRKKKWKSTSAIVYTQYQWERERERERHIFIYLGTMDKYNIENGRRHISSEHSNWIRTWTFVYGFRAMHVYINLFFFLSIKSPRKICIRKNM